MSGSGIEHRASGSVGRHSSFQIHNCVESSLQHVIPTEGRNGPCGGIYGMDERIQHPASSIVLGGWLTTASCRSHHHVIPTKRATRASGGIYGDGSQRTPVRSYRFLDSLRSLGMTGSVSSRIPNSEFTTASNRPSNMSSRPRAGTARAEGSMGWMSGSSIEHPASGWVSGIPNSELTAASNHPTPRSSPDNPHLRTELDGMPRHRQGVFLQ